MSEEDFTAEEKKDIVKSTLEKIDKINQETGISKEKLLGSLMLETIIKHQIQCIQNLAKNTDTDTMLALNQCCQGILDGMDLNEDWHHIPKSCYDEVCEKILNHK